MAEPIPLPKPALKGKVSLEEAISRRRSRRNFRDRDLSREQIGQLLWAAQGITGRTAGAGLRTAPSAGALYPLEVYAVTKAGVFRYLPDRHSIESLADKDLRQALADAALGQESVSQAPLDLVLCAVYGRVTGKYGERGVRYVRMEAGHAAQNMHLQAAALGLGSVPIGAMDDKAVQKVLSLPRDQEPLYIIPVGYPD